MLLFLIILLSINNAASKIPLYKGAPLCRGVLFLHVNDFAKQYHHSA